MYCRLIRAAFCALLLFLLFSLPTLSQANLDSLKKEYQENAAQLKEHIVDGWWIDDAPQSPELLGRHWSLAAEYLVAWMNAYPEPGGQGIRAAFADLGEPGDPDFLELEQDIYAVSAPGTIGNVFLVAKQEGKFRVAWNIAKSQGGKGASSEILAAWLPENARQGGRGPYYASSGSEGSLLPNLGILPADGQGRPRFYIDAIYAQSAGGTVGAQITVWLWDGHSVRVQAARAYPFMIDQKTVTRVEGDLLKVQEKKSFRTFFSCGTCEERQTDWTLELTPEGVRDLGEQSLVPELDAVDELFYRIIRGLSAAGYASPAATRFAASLVRGVQGGETPEEWKEFPSLGMMGTWKVDGEGDHKTLCIMLDDVGVNLFTLLRKKDRWFISDIHPTEQACKPCPGRLRED